MVYVPTGAKASELIKMLEEAIKKYGDRECFSGGTDYPEGVTYVSYRERGDGYHPNHCFVIG